VGAGVAPVVPGNVNAVVVSAFVAVMPVYAVVVSVVVAVSPGTPSVPVTPFAEPSGTTLYCCCSRCRLLCFLSLHPANASAAANTTATFLIFMTTFYCVQIARYMPEQPLKSLLDVNCYDVES
jgi:hypothetical protein